MFFFRNLDSAQKQSHLSPSPNNLLFYSFAYLNYRASGWLNRFGTRNSNHGIESIASASFFIFTAGEHRSIEGSAARGTSHIFLMRFFFLQKISLFGYGIKIRTIADDP